MTTLLNNQVVIDPPSAQSPLSHTRTVDRGLVHRAALGEVFLTDIRAIDAVHYLAAAQLPRSHHYWGDHLLSPAAYDPVLLLEVCRQAALAGAHQCYGVPDPDKVILTHHGLNISAPELLRAGPAPAALTARVETTNRRERDGAVMGLDFVIDLMLDGSEIARSEIGLRFKSPTDYAALRLRGRGGTVPISTAMMPEAGAGRLPPPYLVGRHLPANILLLDPKATARSASAKLRIPGDHPSLFDHPQDHIPGMVLVEAGRQLALYTVREQLGLATSKTRVVAMTASYQRFGELEPETRLEAVLSVSDDAAASLALTENLPVRAEITASQDGEPICGMSFQLEKDSR